MHNIAYASFVAVPLKHIHSLRGVGAAIYMIELTSNSFFMG